MLYTAHLIYRCLRRISPRGKRRLALRQRRALPRRRRRPALQLEAHQGSVRPREPELRRPLHGAYPVGQADGDDREQRELGDHPDIQLCVQWALIAGQGCS